MFDTTKVVSERLEADHAVGPEMVRLPVLSAMFPLVALRVRVPDALMVIAPVVVVMSLWASRVRDGAVIE